jgi:hypothetical protein
MEMESKRASVNDIWDDLKKDEAIRSTQKSAARTKVDWNSYHIRDAIKPKKRFYPAVRSCDSHLADYCLMEAAHLFRNSSGALEIGCPYECRSEKCRSVTGGESGERRADGEKGALPGDGDRQPDLVVSQYAKLKAAYQEKLRKEKLASLAVCVEQMKEGEEVAEERQGKRKEVEEVEEVRQNREGMRDDDSVQRLLAAVGKLTAEKEEREDGGKDHGGEAGVMEGDGSSKDEEQFLTTNSEQGKELAMGVEPEKQGSCDDLVKVAPPESRSVRFALPEEEESRDPATTENGNAGDDSERQGLANALNRDLNSLTDAVGGVRLAALERLQSTLFGSAVEALEDGSSAQNGGEEGGRET